MRGVFYKVGPVTVSMRMYVDIGGLHVHVASSARGTIWTWDWSTSGIGRWDLLYLDLLLQWHDVRSLTLTTCTRAIAVIVVVTDVAHDSIATGSAVGRDWRMINMDSSADADAHDTFHWFGMDVRIPVRL